MLDSHFSCRCTEISVVYCFVAYIETVLTENRAEGCQSVRAFGIFTGTRDVCEPCKTVNVYHVLGDATHCRVIIASYVVEAGYIVVYADGRDTGSFYAFKYIIYHWLV